MSTTLVVEQGVATLLDRLPRFVAVVPRKRAPWWRRADWAPLDVDETAQALQAIPPCTVLVRPVGADPGSACLPPLARAMGFDVVELPPEPEDAAWSVAISAQLDPDAPSGRRARDVICCGPNLVGRHVRRSSDSSSVPALRPATIGRWAECAWQACQWCAGGGGLVDAGCRRCGLPIAVGAVGR